jgi:hypothetical protein
LVDFAHLKKYVPTQTSVFGDDESEQVRTLYKGEPKGKPD